MQKFLWIKIYTIYNNLLEVLVSNIQYLEKYKIMSWWNKRRIIKAVAVVIVHHHKKKGYNFSKKIIQLQNQLFKLHC